MTLFPADTVKQLLPFEGEALYHGPVLAHAAADAAFASLMQTIDWQHDEAMIFGRHIVTKRKVAWYGDCAFGYAYSGINRLALPWTDELLALKATVEELCGAAFNSCLLNLYHTGEEGMGWHSDDEKTMGEQPVIASLSLGAERKFSFRHKQTKETVSLVLEHGSLLVMQGETQTHWHHALPKTIKVKHPRINLTFRQFMPKY
jgi:alkylated DNA repair dioxygenase AlkB